ncbi:MAG: ATP-binding cassette domain-containing protein, partial [Paracoccaceae bacterium]
RLTTLAPAARPVSLLFQSHNLFAHLSVFQNVALGVRPDLKLDAAQRSGVTAALERVGLADKAAQFPAALSGGQAQRAALARALLRDRPLLLLDEPFAALGPALRAEMLDLVDEIVSQTCATLLMVTHDPVDARRLGDLTALVADGIVHAPRPTPELFADPPEALRAYLG